jgi:hypothetical protein
MLIAIVKDEYPPNRISGYYNGLFRKQYLVGSSSFNIQIFIS